MHTVYQNRDAQCFIAVRVRGRIELNLLGVWAKPDPFTGQGKYPRSIAKALLHYEPLLKDAPAIVCGDFNSNVCWDTARKPSHRNLVQQLSEMGLVSAWHSFMNEAQGAESCCTIHHMHNPEKPYHVDYCFIPQTWETRIQSVSLATWDNVGKMSDHFPLIVEIE